jgi:hypothetical protein
MNEQIELIARPRTRITLLDKMRSITVSEPRQRPDHPHTLQRQPGHEHRLLLNDLQEGARLDRPSQNMLRSQPTNGRDDRPNRRQRTRSAITAT